MMYQCRGLCYRYFNSHQFIDYQKSIYCKVCGRFLPKNYMEVLEMKKIPYNFWTTNRCVCCSSKLRVVARYGRSKVKAKKSRI